MGHLSICYPAGTRRSNNVFTTSTRRRRRRVDVVKTLSLRHYCAMCPLGYLFSSLASNSDRCITSCSLTPLQYIALRNQIWIGILLVISGLCFRRVTGGLARPHLNNMAQLNWHAKYPKPLQIYGWVICYEINWIWKKIPYRVKFVHWCWSEMWRLAGNSPFICGM